MVKQEAVSPTPSVSLISSLEGVVITVDDSDDGDSLPQSSSAGAVP